MSQQQQQQQQQQQHQRTRLEIIGDILSTARDNYDDESGSTITYLIKKTNMSHPRLSKMLKMLVAQGLLEAGAGPGMHNRYKISQNGREFLLAYDAFTSFASDYGLNV